MAPKRRELEGKTFGELKVLDFDHMSPHHGTMWKCQCSCGEFKIVRGSHLTSGNTTRCFKCAMVAKHRKKSVGEISFVYWRQTIRGALSRGIEVSITPQQAWELFQKQGGRCAMTGLPLMFPPRANRPHLSTASIDRKRSDVGYTVENCQWVHKVVNRMKMELTDDEFVAWCDAVSKYRKTGVVSDFVPERVLRAKANKSNPPEGNGP